MTDKNISKFLLFLGTFVTLAGAIVLILFHAEKEYVITSFTLCTGFSSALMTYVNSNKDLNGGSNGTTKPTLTITPSAPPAP